GRLGGVKVQAGASSARIGATLGTLRATRSAPFGALLAPRLDLLR
ncbi:MAG: hypothetical protein QOH73_727, partial [Gaiellaceae bacterium]|nr:hypothetical protein [Gaiellaceae bacterium]